MTNQSPVPAVVATAVVALTADSLTEIAAQILPRVIDEMTADENNDAWGMGYNCPLGRKSYSATRHHDVDIDKDKPWLYSISVLTLSGQTIRKAADTLDDVYHVIANEVAFDLLLTKKSLLSACTHLGLSKVA
ncbi:hypothetical protein ACOI1H_21485 [Loktanella sp. DJP18]|uniref:hypothetical protein n=1 Tax=Loktanella sp. DJP18 TaxID=3409788 RepID=UPI003BB5BC18